VARVLVTRQLPAGGLDPLVSAGHEIVQHVPDLAMTTDELADAAGLFDAIVCVLTDRISEPVLAAGAAGRLKVVGNIAVGYDNIDTAAARRYGIAICNTPGVLDQSTADLAFLLILAACRRTSDAEADLRAGRWTGWSITDHLGRDVHGAVLGLVGYGRIAREVARRAAAFEMEVLHHARHDTGLPGYVARLEDLLPAVDVLSLHVPLNETTYHLIGRAELERMRRGSVLVNTSRGAVVDETALIEAIEHGTIFGAGLDVYEDEPAINPALLATPHTVLLPHVGSATIETRTQMARLCCEGVNAVLSGRVPENLVT